jgi:mersacidin/lichenicidin family type 2 lantibiotic
MSKQNIIRAWKDRAYRRGLSQAERAALPANPAGRLDLTAAELAEIAGGSAPATGIYCSEFFSCRVIFC